MATKGVILIVEDRLEEKIGAFENDLTNDGYTIKISETLEQAKKDIEELLKRDILDGVILDFSFPVSEEDPSVNINGIPCGVALLRKCEFKISNKRIPVVINTTGDEEYKRKYLGDMKKFSTPLYNVNHQANPLAQATVQMKQQILKLFNSRTEQRQLINGIVQDNKWLQRGKTGVYDRKTGHYTYLRDGD